MMKRISCAVIALMLLFTFSFSAMAAGSTGGSTEITYIVESDYIVKIPVTVNITGTTGTQTVSVDAESLIPANQKLQFIITNSVNYGGDPAGFRMKNNVGTNIYLRYTISGKIGSGDAYNVDKGTAATAGSVVTNPFLEVTATEAYAGKSVTLTYTVGNAEAAGTYSDILTFTVGLADNS